MAELWSSTPTQSLSATHVVDAERPLADTREHLAQGFVSFKLKVGRDWSRELELVRILRSELGAIALRLDANGAWSLAEAQRALRDLAALDITWVEQPVAAPLFAELGASPVPLAADESLQAGERAVLPDGAIYVLKPTTVGGLRRCLALATRGPAVISHTLEGPVATATCCELALSLETTPSLPQGIERHPGLASFPEVAVPQLDGASIRRCAHRGHGVRWEHLWAL